jgi:hypothetical protein
MARQQTQEQDLTPFFRLLEDSRYQGLSEEGKQTAIQRLEQRLGYSLPESEISGAAQTPQISESPSSIAEKTLGFVAPATAGVIGGAVGFRFGGLKGANLVGNLAAEAADTAMRKLTGQEVRQPLTSTITGDVENQGSRFAVNILEGVTLESGIAKGVKLAKSFAPATKAFLDRLNPTLGQRLDSKIVKALEDTLAPSAKEASVAKSASAAITEAETVASELSSRGVNINTFKSELGNTISGNLADNFRRTLAMAGADAEQLKVIAGANVLRWPPTVTSSNRIISGGSGIVKEGISTSSIPSSLRNLPPDSVEIAGPIHLRETFAAVNKLRRTMLEDAGITGVENTKVFGTYSSLLENINDELSSILVKAGVSPSDAERMAAMQNVPISFTRAWGDKKKIGELAFETFDASGMPSHVQSQLIEVYSALDKDISDGIRSWGVDGESATQLWQETKELTSTAYLMNAPSGADAIKTIVRGNKEARKIGLALDTNLNTIKTPSKLINSVLDDENTLNRAIDQGRIKVPGLSGELIATKGDLSAYQFMRILDDNLDRGAGRFNSTALLTDWRAYKDSSRGSVLYSAAEKNRLNEVVEAIARSNERIASESGTRYFGMRGSTYAVGALSTFLVAGSLSSGAATTGLTLGGALLTGHALARVAINPKSSAILAKFIKGAPLDMSMQAASRTVAIALRGEPIQLEFLKEDGSQVLVDGIVNDQGRFEANLGQAQTPQQEEDRIRLRAAGI